MDWVVSNLDKIPTGVNTFGWLGVLSVLLHFGWKNRREAHNETTHLRQEMEAFTERMSEENKQLMLQVSELRAENKELRQEVRGLQGVIDGLRRQSNAEHIGTQRALMSAIPLEAVPASTRELLDRMGNQEGAENE